MPTSQPKAALIFGTINGLSGNRHYPEIIGDDDDWDVLLTHLPGESKTLYRNVGEGIFVDNTAAWGLRASPGYKGTSSETDS